MISASETSPAGRLLPRNKRDIPVDRVVSDTKEKSGGIFNNSQLEKR